MAETFRLRDLFHTLPSFIRDMTWGFKGLKHGDLKMFDVRRLYFLVCPDVSSKGRWLVSAIIIKSSLGQYIP